MEAAVGATVGSGVCVDGGVMISPEAVGTAGEGAGFSVLPAPGAQDIAIVAATPATAIPARCTLLRILPRNPGRTCLSIFSVISFIYHTYRIPVKP